MTWSSRSLVELTMRKRVSFAKQNALSVLPPNLRETVG